MARLCRCLSVFIIYFLIQTWFSKFSRTDGQNWWPPRAFSGPLSAAKSAEIELLFGRNSCSADSWGSPTLTKFDFFKDAWWIWNRHFSSTRMLLGDQTDHTPSAFMRRKRACSSFLQFLGDPAPDRSTENFYLVLRNASHVEPGAASQSLLTIACRISGVCTRVEAILWRWEKNMLQMAIVFGRRVG